MAEANERMARVETLLDGLVKTVDGIAGNVSSIEEEVREIKSKMTVEPELHVKHHAAVQRFIEREDAAQARREKVKAHVIGWSVVTVITGVGYAVGYTVLEFVRGLLKIKGLL